MGSSVIRRAGTDENKMSNALIIAAILAPWIILGLAYFMACAVRTIVD